MALTLTHTHSLYQSAGKFKDPLISNQICSYVYHKSLCNVKKKWNWYADFPQILKYLLSINLNTFPQPPGWSDTSDISLTKTADRQFYLNMLSLIQVEFPVA